MNRMNNFCYACYVLLCVQSLGKQCPSLRFSLSSALPPRKNKKQCTLTSLWPRGVPYMRYMRLFVSHCNPGVSSHHTGFVSLCLHCVHCPSKLPDLFESDQVQKPVKHVTSKPLYDVYRLACNVVIRVINSLFPFQVLKSSPSSSSSHIDAIDLD